MNKKRDDRAWVEVRIRPFSRTADHCSSYLLWFIHHIKGIERPKNKLSLFTSLLSSTFWLKDQTVIIHLKSFLFHTLPLAYSNLTRHCENLQQFLARFSVNKNLSLDLFLMQNYHMTWEDLHIKGHISKISVWNNQKKKLRVNVVKTYE